MSERAAVTVTVVDASDADALAALFARDVCPCYCRYWHFEGTNKEWELRCATDPSISERELRDAIAARSIEASGLVARIDADPTIVGWMKLAPRASLPKLTARPPYRALDEDASTVWSIGCFLVDAAHRRQGVARALLARAIEVAPKLGARFLEAYPRTAPDRMLHDAEAWNGHYETYLALGFSVVRESPQYPVMRRPVT